MICIFKKVLKTVQLDEYLKAVQECHMEVEVRLTILICLGAIKLGLDGCIGILLLQPLSKLCLRFVVTAASDTTIFEVVNIGARHHLLAFHALQLGVVFIPITLVDPLLFGC